MENWNSIILDVSDKFQHFSFFLKRWSGISQSTTVQWQIRRGGGGGGVRDMPRSQSSQNSRKTNLKKPGHPQFLDLLIYLVNILTWMELTSELISSCTFLKVVRISTCSQFISRDPTKMNKVECAFAFPFKKFLFIPKISSRAWLHYF